MAKLVTLADLITDVRALYEIRDISISDTILTRWINRSLALLHDHVIKANPDYYLSSTDITITSGTRTYDLSSLITDFYKGHGADVLLDNGDYSPLRNYPWEERDLYASTVVQRADQLYRFMGSNLHLAPEPAWSGTIRIWYIPTATVLTSSPANSVDLMNSWEEFVICDTAIKCAIKEEASTTALERRRAELVKDIRSFASQRDFSHNERIRDTGRMNAALANPFARLPRP